MCLFLKNQLHCNLFSSICQRQTCTFIQRFMSVVPPNKIDVPIKLVGRFASNEQKRIITEFVTNSDSTVVDWKVLKMSVLSVNRGYINEKNINGCVLESCSKNKRLDLAKSYMKYLKECVKIKPNIALELLYLRSCYLSKDQLTDDDRHEIQATCQFLFENNSQLLNSVLIEGLTMGICCTPSWRNSLEYLKAVKNERDITVLTTICIILKAFEDGEIDLGWTLTQNMFNLHEVLPLEVFDAWFNACEKNINCRYHKVLEFLRDNECVIKEDLAKLICEKFKQYGSKVMPTIIYHSSGKCKNCNQSLKPVDVSDSEFKILQECFMSNVMVGKNIFNNSSPQELTNFKNFIQKTAPYDVVVDGLNLAYAFRGKIKNNSLTKVVMKIFIDQKLKVLLIGRNHLIKMLGNEFDFIKENAHLFLTNDLSKDDPFVLYAAMLSGFGTKILTRDLMRSHKFVLGDNKIKSIFQKWLQNHRLVLKTHAGDKVIIKNPITHLQTTQETKDGIWHVPYTEFKEPGLWSKPDSSPDNWICIKS